MVFAAFTFLPLGLSFVVNNSELDGLAKDYYPVEFYSVWNSVYLYYSKNRLTLSGEFFYSVFKRN